MRSDIKIITIYKANWRVISQGVVFLLMLIQQIKIIHLKNIFPHEQLFKDK